MGTYTIESFLTSFTPNTINNSFIYIMVCLVVIGVILKLKKYEKYNNFITYIPSLLTSLGIFGTFVGISIGLVNFDPANIDKSISELLEGMKTAFYSSLVGVFFSICFKIFLSYVKSNEIDTDDDEQILKLIERQTVSIENVTKILGSDSDTSVLTQIKLFKSDINDYINYTKNFNDKFALTLWDKMENFADILSKSATETIIQALNDVIKDFNKNLTEQFGDNFKQLNSAVLKLVEWQEQYKSQLELWQKNYDDHKVRIDTLTQQQQEYTNLLIATYQMIERSRASLDNIAENTDLIPKHMSDLSEIMEVHEKQLIDLNMHLKAFEEVKDKASKAFPEIKDSVNEIMLNIKNSVDNTTAHYNNLVSETHRIQETVSNIIANFIKEESEQITALFTSLDKKIQENISNINKTIESNLNDMLTSQNKGIDVLFSKIDTTLQEQVSKTANSIDRQVKIIDESMEQELKRGLEEIGKALAQISAKVVEEYNRMYEASNN